MGRMTKKGTMNANLWLWIGIVFFCLIGLAGIILSLFPNIEPIVMKDSLQTKEVTVSVLDYHDRYRSADTYFIRITDGEKFILSGSYDRYDLVKEITSGKRVIVKWYRSRFPAVLMAEEIFLDGKQIVFYDNDQKLDRKITFFLGCAAILMGTGCFAAIRYDRKLSIKSREQGKGSTKGKNKKRKR